MSEVVRYALIDWDGGNILASVLPTIVDPTKNALQVSIPDGVSLKTWDIEIWAVELKNGTDDTRGTIGAKWATTALNVALVDESWNQIVTFWSATTPANTARTATDQVNLSQLIDASWIVNAVQWGVASGSTDNWNPVKVWWKYNTTLPTLTNGQRWDFQVDANWRLITAWTATWVSGSLTNAEYQSPYDFTATYTSNVTVTISWAPFTVEDATCTVTDIWYKPTAWIRTQLTNGWSGVSMTASANVITVAWAWTPFASGDLYKVGIDYQRKAHDANLDVTKVIIQNPEASYYQDVVPLISTAYELTNVFTDVGFEIPCIWYKYLTLWFTIDVNSSTWVEIRILHKHTSWGAEEYREIFLWSPAWWQTTINLNDYLIASDSDQLFKITLDITWTPYIQIQAKDFNNSDWQVDSLYYTLTY